MNSHLHLFVYSYLFVSFLLLLRPARAAIAPWMRLLRPSTRARFTIFLDRMLYPTFHVIRLNPQVSSTVSIIQSPLQPHQALPFPVMFPSVASSVSKAASQHRQPLLVSACMPVLRKPRDASSAPNYFFRFPFLIFLFTFAQLMQIFGNNKTAGNRDENGRLKSGQTSSC
jgi:hypothetical protein